MPFPGSLLFLVLLWTVAGCSSSKPPRLSNATPLPDQTTRLPATRTLQPLQPPVQSPLTQFLLSLQTNQWAPLDLWCAARGFSMGIQPMAPKEYQVETENGRLTLSAGSRVALWNGMEVWLGYAPRLQEGKLNLHRLDLQKTFQPLTSPWMSRRKATPIIVIDPGHGGLDGGAKSVVSPMTEKSFTLDWALRLRNLLSTNGWEVYLTRTNDVEVTLADRVSFAEKVRADLFLSLHFNSAFPRKEFMGLETYCLTPQGLPSNLTRGYEDDPTSVFPNNHYDEENFRLAANLHRELLRATGGKDRGIRRARFLSVLRGQQRPAVLLEGGYLSNPEEAALIATPSFRQKLAEAVARGLIAGTTTLPLAATNNLNRLSLHQHP